jgi:hypothetical protein
MWASRKKADTKNEGSGRFLKKAAQKLFRNWA